jgi:hypothetical protein
VKGRGGCAEGGARWEDRGVGEREEQVLSREGVGRGHRTLLTPCCVFSQHSACNGAVSPSHTHTRRIPLYSHKHTQTHTCIYTYPQVVYDHGPVPGHTWEDFDALRARVEREWAALPPTADNLSPSLRAKVAAKVAQRKAAAAAEAAARAAEGSKAAAPGAGGIAISASAVGQGEGAAAPAACVEASSTR